MSTAHETGGRRANERVWTSVRYVLKSLMSVVHLWTVLVVVVFLSPPSVMAFGKTEVRARVVSWYLGLSGAPGIDEHYGLKLVIESPEELQGRTLDHVRLDVADFVLAGEVIGSGDVVCFRISEKHLSEKNRGAVRFRQLADVRFIEKHRSNPVENDAIVSARVLAPVEVRRGSNDQGPVARGYRIELLPDNTAKAWHPLTLVSLDGTPVTAGTEEIHAGDQIRFRTRTSKNNQISGSAGLLDVREISDLEIVEKRSSELGKPTGTMVEESSQKRDPIPWARPTGWQK